MCRPLCLLLPFLALLAPAIAQAVPHWDHPDSSEASKDWIRMSSGEWLRGEIHTLNDDDLDFESEDLDDLELDWDDVVELRSGRVLTWRFHVGGVVTGRAILRDGTVWITPPGGGARVELPRSDLLSAIEGRPTEWNYWSVKASLGLIARSGNTEQEDFNTTVLLRRQSTRSRLDLDYTGNYSNTRDIQTVNNHNGGVKLDFTVARNVFLTPFGGRLYTDRFQNIDLRATVGAGGGVFLIRDKDLEFYVELGAGYQSTRFVSVEAGESDQEESFTLLPAISVEWDITGSIDLDASYNAEVTVPEVQNTVHHFFALLSIELTSILDFDTSLTWDRVETPKADSDGVVPKQDDLRFFFGLGVDF